MDGLNLSSEQAVELLESISSAFYGLDRDWRFVYLNQKAALMLGRPRHELIGKVLWEEFPQGKTTESYAYFLRAMNEQQPARYETFSQYLNVWVEVEISPTRSGISVYFHDITQRKRVDAALRSNEQRLALLLDALPFFVTYIDTNQRYRFVNKSFLNVIGVQQDQVIGKSIVEVIGPELYSVVQENVQIALSGQTAHYEGVAPYPRGTIYTKAHLVPHVRDDGTVAGFITISQDITEAKKAEIGLTQLAAIVTQSTDAIISTRLDGIVLTWNTGAERIFGYSAEEMVNHSASVIFPPNRVHELAALFARVANGESVQNFETVRMRKDGSLISISVSLSPLRDKHNTCFGASVIARDITERKREEEQLRRSEAALKLAQSVAHVGNWTMQLPSRRREWSDEMYRIFGIDQASFAGDLNEAVTRSIHPDDRDRLEQALIATFRTGAGEPIEYRIIRPDGTVRTVWAELAGVVRDSSGSVIEISGIVQDITERRQAEDAVHASEARLAGIIESAMDAIITVDEEQRIVLFNHAAEVIFRCETENAVGAPLDRFLPTRFRDAHKTHIRNFGLTGITTRRMEMLGGITGLRSDGDEFPIEASISQIEANGKKYFTVILRDITERKREEVRIRQSEAELKQAQAIAHLGSWKWQIQTNRLEWSDEMYRMFGIDQSNFTGDLAEVIGLAIHPDDRALVESSNASVIRDKKPAPLEYRVIWPDGTVRTVWGEAGDVILDDAGNPAVLTGIVLDITERKRAEVALQRYAQRLEILHALDLGLIKGDSVRELVETTLNQLRRVIPCQRADVIVIDESGDSGLIFAVDYDAETELKPGVRVNIPADTHTFFNSRNLWVVDDFRDLLDTRPQVKRYIDDGLLSGLRVLFVAEGKFIGSLGLLASTPAFFTIEYQDIAVEVAGQLSIALHQLRLSESVKRYVHRLEILHTLDVGLIQGTSVRELVDATLQQLQRVIPCQRIDVVLVDEEANDAVVFAVVVDGDTQLTEGTHVPIPPDVFAGYDDRHMRVFHDIREFQDIRPRARQLVSEGLLSALSVLLMDGERPIGVLGLFADTPNLFTAEYQDIAVEIASQLSIAVRQLRLNEALQKLTNELEQKVLERTAQLKSVNQQLDEFAYVVSHDLKAPLRGITQLASWLDADYAQYLDDEGRNMLKLMVGRSKRMHDMIEAILQYSRLGRTKQSLTAVDLNSLVASVVDLLAPPPSITITVAPNLPTVRGDETRLRQVFQNLIGNAIKYMDKPAGQITISWSDESTHWQFAVADNGPGIASQYYDKIFQLFQTLSARDEVESTGIGLALVKKIVELYDHGHIWLESTVGQGTIFYFTLGKMHGE